jgi:hypothetical protein
MRPAPSEGTRLSPTRAAATATTGGPYLDVLYDKGVLLGLWLWPTALVAKEYGVRKQAIDYKATATNKKARTILPA